MMVQKSIGWQKVQSDTLMMYGMSLGDQASVSGNA